MRRHLFLACWGCLALAVVAGLRAAPQPSFATRMPDSRRGSMSTARRQRARGL